MDNQPSVMPHSTQVVNICSKQHDGEEVDNAEDDPEDGVTVVDRDCLKYEGNSKDEVGLQRI